MHEGGGNLSTTTASMMLCPSCGMSLAPKGRLTIAPEPEKILTQAEKNQAIIDELFKSGEDDLLKCKVCSRVCKSIAGLAAHMRTHQC